MQRTVLALCLTIAFTDPIVNAIVYAEAPQQTIESLLAEACCGSSQGGFSFRDGSVSQGY